MVIQSQKRRLLSQEERSLLSRTSLLPTLLSAVLVLSNTRCWAFSVVAPPHLQARKASTSQWDSKKLVQSTKVIEPNTLLNRDAFATISASKMHQPSPLSPDASLMPALSSPLFRGPKTKEQRISFNKKWDSLRHSTVKQQSEMPRAQFLSRFIHLLGASLVDELEQARSVKEKKDFVSRIQADTNELHRTMRAVLDAQNNVKDIWNVAGEAVVGYGLSDAQSQHFLG